MEYETVYIIWSEEHRGWWKPNRNGYTPKRDHAGHYDFDEAQEIVLSANIAERDVPNEAIVPIKVCAFCHGEGEVSTDEMDGDGNLERGVGTRKCICRSE